MRDRSPKVRGDAVSKLKQVDASREDLSVEHLLGQAAY
jgi:hypothetical protein